MQHVAGKPLHRSTVWRRNRQLDQRSQPTGSRGRKWASEWDEKSFIGFVGAVISLVLKKGYCDFSELFPCGKSGDSRRYHPARAEVLTGLRKSPYPPAMMVVAICELIPLNFATRGGPGSASINETEWKARKNIRDSRPLFERLKTAFISEGYSQASADQAALSVDALPRTEQPAILSVLLPQQSPDLGEPLGSSCAGTPAHRIDYCRGASITRAMASYWRNHRLYRKCKAWLRTLLPSSIPQAPYRERVVYTPKLLNASFVEYLKKRRRDRLGALMQPSPS
jgi:hypothetical protein